MIREPPAVRFQAEHSNALWHFDMSPSDLKQLRAPPWIDPDRQGAPILMLFSVVDDRSGVAYQEYRCVYGEEVEAALKFLFNAMAPKANEGDPFQGIPSTLHLDNGPVAKSAVFKRVMESLGVAVIPHMPAESDGRRTTARAKGKVERPFRTVKEAHETLYHVHQPESEEEANQWLARFEAGFEMGVKPIDARIVEAVLSRQINDLEAQLTRNGYDIRSLVEQVEAKPAEIRQLLRGELDAGRTRELLDEMRAAGLPT
jgi:hypothetical protein